MNDYSMYLDVMKLKSPKDLKKKKVVKREKREETLFDTFKRLAAKRFGTNSINYVKYNDLAGKFIDGGPDLKMSFDLLMKSDARIFGNIL
jgi:hypothetical protein